MGYVVCKSGKCKEHGTIESNIDSLFNDDDVIEKIEHDLVRDAMNTKNSSKPRR